jgi:hypothetical protein
MGHSHGVSKDRINRRTKYKIKNKNSRINKNKSKNKGFER